MLVPFDAEPLQKKYPEKANPSIARDGKSRVFHKETAGPPGEMKKIIPGGFFCGVLFMKIHPGMK